VIVRDACRPVSAHPNFHAAGILCRMSDHGSVGHPARSFSSGPDRVHSPGVGLPGDDGFGSTWAHASQVAGSHTSRQLLTGASRRGRCRITTTETSLGRPGHAPRFIIRPGLGGWHHMHSSAPSVLTAGALVGPPAGSRVSNPVIVVVRATPKRLATTPHERFPGRIEIHPAF